MICEGCKRNIEKQIDGAKGKNVNCMGHGCKNGAQCSRRDIVNYCIELLCPKEEKKDEIH